MPRGCLITCAIQIALRASVFSSLLLYVRATINLSIASGTKPCHHEMFRERRSFLCELTAEPVLFFFVFFCSRQCVPVCMSQLFSCQGVNRVNLWLLFALSFTSYLPLRSSIMALNGCIFLYHYMGLLYMPSLPASLCLLNCDNAGDVLRQ